jgi:type IV pilus assembly protein PilM
VFKQLGRKRGARLSIDIGAQTITMLQVVSQDNGSCIEAYASMPGNLETAVSCIKSMRQSFTANRVIMAIPDTSVVNKTLSLPANLTEADMEALIRLEMQKCFPLADMQLDFQVRDCQKRPTDLVDVSVTATHSQNIQKRIDLLSQTGLKPWVIEVESQALQRVAQTFIQEDRPVALLDIEAHNLGLWVFESKRLVFTKDVPLVGASEAMAHQLQARLTMHIKRALQFFYSANSYPAICRIFLAGNVGRIPGLALHIQSCLGIPTELANPLSSMALDFKVDKWTITHDAPLLLLACGLGLREE